MSNIEEYISQIDESLEKLQNNYEYYKAFGSFYIMSRIREDLDSIIDSINNVKNVAGDFNK